MIHHFQLQPIAFWRWIIYHCLKRIEFFEAWPTTLVAWFRQDITEWLESWCGAQTLCESSLRVAWRHCSLCSLIALRTPALVARLMQSRFSSRYRAICVVHHPYAHVGFPDPRELQVRGRLSLLDAHRRRSIAPHLPRKKREERRATYEWHAQGRS